jgi:VIT1/CCC1 family predicted Fe2+/Mn2+ transporter
VERPHQGRDRSITRPDLAVIASFIISTVAHFAVGASKALVTTRPWWASGTEMTVVGILEATITYGVGYAFAGHGG